METKSMTEKEIIQYWVNNHKEMRVFKHAPLDCRLWLKKNPQAALILHQDGYGWYKPCDVFFDGLVYTIPEDILKEKESGFIEFDKVDTLEFGGYKFSAKGIETVEQIANSVNATTKKRQQKECKQMTEKEIIQYWVNNHKEMRAFVAAPEECQVWLKEHKKIIFHLNGIGKWVKTSKENKIVAFSIFTIHEDILKEKESGFIEFDIDDLDVFTHPFGANGSDRKRTHWYDYLDAVQSCGLFAGWFFENKAGAGWSIFQMGETETGGWTTIADDWVKPLVPKKIRFYKGV